MKNKYKFFLISMIFTIIFLTISSISLFRNNFAVGIPCIIIGCSSGMCFLLSLFGLGEEQ